MTPHYQVLGGGIDLISPPTTVDPGRCIVAKNYECPITGGYRSVQGYTIYTQPTGTGAILGVVVYKGYLYCIRQNGTYAKLYKWTGSTWSDQTGAVNLPVGRYEFAIGNFQATTYTETLYLQCNGSGKPLSYDGTTLAFLTHATCPSGGKWIVVHHNRLIVCFANGSLQYSRAGYPDDWDAVDGAGEIGVQDTITGIISNRGVLIIGCAKTIKILSGTGTSDFVLEAFADNTGVRPYTMKDFNGPYFVHERGLSSLQATQDYGDFNLGNWGLPVEPLFQDGTLSCVGAVVSKSKSQYRVFFSNKTALFATVVGNKVAIMPVTYAHQMTCVTSGELSTGTEVLAFGDDQGNVYRMDYGTSFGGTAIESWLTFGFNHYKSPTMYKRFHRAWMDVQGQEPTTLYVRPQFDYGDEDIALHGLASLSVYGPGGYWDISDWDEVYWSSPIQTSIDIDMTGIALNMALSVYHSSSTVAPHTITGYGTHYAPRRGRRA